EANLKIQDLQKIAHSLSLSNSVHFLGHVPEIHSFMDHCHIGVIASRGSEAVCRVALEWMAHGKPIVGTQVGSIPEIIEDKRTGYITSPSNPQALAEKIIHLLDHPSIWEEMSRNAKKRFEDHFSLEHFREKSERFYHQILGISKTEQVVSSL
ncbi:MAG: glycosyltransferase family 4 protein, partial [Elusimicrobia bacterium]|nr:glycosyltransferase family 4 protein [Elusimicrobiota bacterium]